MPITKTASRTAERYESQLKHLKIVSFAALTIAFIALVAAATILAIAVPRLASAIASVNHTAISGSNGTEKYLGATLAGIDQPLNSTALAVINNAPDSYFNTAGEMYLNNTLTDPIFISDVNKINPVIVNGKISVVYLGSITCVFCGENRWAMALALSRFGSFSQLFTGYSSLGDSDVPTLYWAAVNYNVSGDDVTNYYSSSYVNFISIEDTNPITGGFQLNSLQTIMDNLQKAGNKSAMGAFEYIINLSAKNATAFKGTPYTIWGNYQFSGADAEVFGNTTPTSGALPLTYMTHGQVLSALANPTSQFAWSEYAAADVYVASMCKSLNNTAPACSLPSIVQLEKLLQ